MTGTPCRSLSVLLNLVVAVPPLLAQAAPVPFASERWSRGPSALVEHLGRTALRGGAVLSDAAFRDGVIEVDVAVDGRRCFPGIVFRMQSPTEAEYVYLRPHRSGEPTALQYTPLFNGLDAWQLYHGPGFTAAADIPHGRWVHLRLEVAGVQARLYLDGETEPALIVDDLKRGAASGTLGLIGPPGGQVHFADFTFTPDAATAFPPPPLAATRSGTVTSWELSRAFAAAEINRFAAPPPALVAEAGWKDVHPEPSGLVNVSRWLARTGTLPDVVLARTTIHSDAAAVRRLAFGYSDEISVFLNGRLLFWGDASFQVRDPMFYGAVGLHDAVFLPLQKGANELLFVVAESFGGWGFMARLTPVPDRLETLGEGVVKLWETPAELSVPESVAFDPARRVLYVSSFARVTLPGTPAEGFLSRLTLDGTVDDRLWVTGLRAPAGLAVRGDRLFAVERDGVAEIDTATGTIVARHPVPGAVFLNDVAAAPDGSLYVSDSGGNVIHRLRDGAATVVAGGADVRQPNGLLLDDGTLLFGNTGDRCVKALDLATGRIRGVVRLDEGIIDGLRTDGAGNLIVSLWHGSVFRVTPTGRVTDLVGTDHAVVPAADLEYVAAERLLVVPTYFGNRVAAYRLDAADTQ